MAKAKPFVKWVGGKTQLIEQLEARICYRPQISRIHTDYYFGHGTHGHH